MRGKNSVVAKFDDEKQYYAMWQLNGQLRVFETDSGDCFLNVKSSGKTTRTDCLLKGEKTALCWFSNQTKRSKDQGRLLFISGGYGIEAIDVFKGEVIWRTQIENGVSDIAVQDGHLYFVSLFERIGGKLDTHQGTVLSKFKIGKHKGKHLIPVLGLEKLVITGTHLLLWDGINEKKLVKYSGHTTEVSALCLSPCRKFIFTGAEDERQLAVWSTQSTKRDAICLFPMDHPVMDISSASLNESLIVCALSTHGVTYIWKCEDLEKEKWKTSFWATIQLEVQGDGLIFSTKVEAKMNEVVVHLVRGNVAFPLFDHCILPDFGSEPTVIILDKKEPHLLPSKDTKTEVEDQKKRKREVMVVGPDNNGQAVQVMHLTKAMKAGKHSERDQHCALKTEELTLGERLAQLEHKQLVHPEESREEKTKAPFLLSSSAAVLVKQINQSGDIELFIRLMQLPRDLATKTVHNLVDTEAAKFLQLCIERLRLRPKEAPSIIWWIRALVKTHAAYLMSSPTIQQQITFVHQLIEHRVAVFDNLVSLSGRLDILLSQVKAQEQSKRDHGGTNVVEMDLSEDESVLEEIDHEEITLDGN
eukprot:g1924.t1